MILTIELSQIQETSLVAAALQAGLKPEDIIRQMVAQHLPDVIDRSSGSLATGLTIGKGTAHVSLVKNIRGKYAHTAKTLGTEELHQERRRDKAKDEAKLREFKR